MAYHRLEPFGHLRWDIGFAMICTVMANAWRDEKKRSQPYQIEDFLPFFEGQEPEVDLESKLAALSGAIGTPS